MTEFLQQVAVEVIPASLWLLSASAFALAVRRLVPVLLPGAIDGADRLLRSVLLSAVLVAGLIAALGLFERLQAIWVLAATLAIWLVSRAVPPAETEHQVGAETLGLRTPGSWPWLAAGGWLGWEALAALPTAPLNWDAMTYHLYFPARWVQEGRIFHIPAVFADNSASYAPQNGPLLFAWILSLTKSDALCNVLQVLAVLVVMLAIYRIVLRIDPTVGPTAAAWTGFLAVMLPPVRRWAYTANVDVLMVAAWLAALNWTLELLGSGGSPSDRRGTLASACLAAGLCAGTKTAGLVLAAPLAVAAVVAWAWPRIRGRAEGEGLFTTTTAVALTTAIGLSLFVLAGGWWYLRNLWLYGNPLFPLDTSILGLHFDGAYSSAAMETSRFNVAFEVWISYWPILFGPVTCVLVAVGWFRLAMVRGLAARSLAVFVPAWCVFEFAVMPYNNQVRFLMPALITAFCGLAPILGRWTARWQAGVSLSVAALLVVNAGPGIGPYDEIVAVAKVATQGLAVYLGCVLVLIALLANLVAGRDDARRGQAHTSARVAAVALLSVALIAMGEVLSRSTRSTLVQGMEYPQIVAFEYPELPVLDIAYAGLNVPYVLTGPDFRHRVRYVNTRGEIDDGFFEHWRRDPKVHDTHRPGIYRGADDARTWLERLDQLGIDAVVVHQFVVPTDTERAVEWPERHGDFPQERGWMRRRPERFKLLGAGETWEIYLVEPDLSATPASE